MKGIQVRRVKMNLLQSPADILLRKVRTGSIP